MVVPLVLFCALLPAAAARPQSVEGLNAQWFAGGIFSHQFDDASDVSHKWLTNLTKRKCVSLSMASAAFPYFYSTSLGGMLFSSDFVLNATDPPVNCACTCDCNSDGRDPNDGSALTVGP